MRSCQNTELQVGKKTSFYRTRTGICKDIFHGLAPIHDGLLPKSLFARPKTLRGILVWATAPRNMIQPMGTGVSFRFRSSSKSVERIIRIPGVKGSGIRAKCLKTITTRPLEPENPGTLGINTLSLYFTSHSALVLLLSFPKDPRGS